MTPRRPRYFLIDIMLVIAFCGLAFATVRWLGRIMTPNPKPAPDNDFTRPLVALELAYILWFLTWDYIGRKRAAPECAECGRRFLAPKKLKASVLCPQCRRRALSPSGIRKDRANGHWAILFLLAVFAGCLAFFFSGFVEARYGKSYWLALPLVAVGATLGLSVALFVPLLGFFMIRNRMMAGTKFALAHARKVAGEEGEESSLGPINLWYSGPTDPSPMLREQMETVRGRFAAMIGEEIDFQGPLRAFCFDRREALVAFQQQTLSNLWNYDGLYNSAPVRLVTLTTEITRYRLSDTEATARSLFTLVLLEQFKGFLPATWLQAGINNALTTGDDDLDRLNRKMVVSIAKGTVYGEELFQLKPGAFFKLLRNWSDHHDFARLSQFIAQSSSLIKYLCAEDRQEPFRAFLKAIRRNEPDEAVFRSQFGHGYDQLLEGWRGWVLERGVGKHEAPSPQIRTALTERLIPSAIDQQGRIMDRILAIRAMGAAGHVLGADTLIDLLRVGGEIPTEEIIWSLEAISGMACGDDLDRWKTWWDGLPRDVREGQSHRMAEAAMVTSPTTENA